MNFYIIFLILWYKDNILYIIKVYNRLFTIIMILVYDWLMKIILLNGFIFNILEIIKYEIF